MLPQKSIQLGMRGPVYGSGDIQMARDFGFTVLTTTELLARTPAEIGELVRSVVGESRAFLTFDIDFFDPAFAPGVCHTAPSHCSHHKLSLPSLPAGGLRNWNSRSRGPDHLPRTAVPKGVHRHQLGGRRRGGGAAFPGPWAGDSTRWSADCLRIPVPRRASSCQTFGKSINAFAIQSYITCTFEYRLCNFICFCCHPSPNV